MSAADSLPDDIATLKRLVLARDAELARTRAEATSADARKARLAEVIEDVGTKTLRYIYDFGDGWEHTIKIERLDDPEPGALYPRLIEARGRCPP